MCSEVCLSLSQVSFWFLTVSREESSSNVYVFACDSKGCYNYCVKVYIIIKTYTWHTKQVLVIFYLIKNMRIHFFVAEMFSHLCQGFKVGSVIDSNIFVWLLYKNYLGTKVFLCDNRFTFNPCISPLWQV